MTFVIQERNGGPDAGYISSGFFGGLAVGRLGLIWFSRWVRIDGLLSPRFFLTSSRSVKAV